MQNTYVFPSRGCSIERLEIKPSASTTERQDRFTATLIFSMWLFGLWDLASTIAASRFDLLEEVNPLARAILGNQRYVLLGLFKLGVMLPSSLLLWKTRRLWISQRGLVIVATAYLGLAAWWIKFWCIAWPAVAAIRAW
jgi:hypothetical protein